MMTNFKTKHVVMYSGGAGSAWVGKYVADKFGTENTILLHTDTKWEDEDNYRFMKDCADYIGVEITNISDGRTPEDIFKEDLYFGNFGTAPCSKKLKMHQTFEYIQNLIMNGVLPILYFGIDYGEVRRAPRIAYNYKHNVDVFEDGVEVRFPLIGEVDGMPVSGEQLLYGTDYLTADKMPKMYNNLVYGCLEAQNFVKCEANSKEEIQNEWGIKLPRMYDLGFSHANCFSGDTRFITDQGVKTFEETLGKDIKVLGVGANWQEATIKHFGKQQIVELTLSRNGTEKTIRTTKEHRWFKRKGRKNYVEAYTQDLKEGDYLKSMYSKANPLVRPSSFGVAHGITFGDGSVTNKWNPPARLMLCGNKADQLLKYFTNCPQTLVEGVGVEVKDLPRYFKQLPSIEESKSYLYGWLVGYFAADGNATDGEFSLSSAYKENLDFVRDVATIVGIGTNPVRKSMRKGFGEEESPLYSVSFVASTLNDSMFIKEKHIKEYESHKQKEVHKPKEWKVVSIQETDEVEDVYCAVVPNGQAFTLEDNLFTGNCAGRCIKAGKGHYATLFAVWKDRYLEQEKMEREINEAQMAKNGRRYTILSKAVETGELDDKGKPKKKKVPYSLEEYRKEVLEGDIHNCKIEIFEDESDSPCECVF